MYVCMYYLDIMCVIHEVCIHNHMTAYTGTYNYTPACMYRVYSGSGEK